MSEHIKLDGIECEKLVYLRASDSWCCLARFDDIGDADFCLECKFKRQLIVEDIIAAGKMYRVKDRNEKIAELCGVV